MPKFKVRGHRLYFLMGLSQGSRRAYVVALFEKYNLSLYFVVLCHSLSYGNGFCYVILVYIVVYFLCARYVISFIILLEVASHNNPGK